MTTDKKVLLSQIFALSNRLGTIPSAPADDRPRWKDGSLRDPLAQLEESIDLERAATDTGYYMQHKAEVNKLRALRAERAREEQAAADNAVALERHERRAERREAKAAEAAKIEAEKAAALQDRVNRFHDGDGS